MSKEKEVVQAAVKTGFVEGSIKELEYLIKARMPLIQVVTFDEERFIKEVFDKICKDTSGKEKRRLFYWSQWQGMCEYKSSKSFTNVKRADGTDEGTWNPQKALEKILGHVTKKDDELIPAIFVMRDMPTVLAQPIPRQMKDMYAHMLQNAKTVIVLGGTLCHGAGGTKGGIEPTLEKQIVVFRWKLPDRKEIENMLRHLVSKAQNLKKEIVNDYTDQDFYDFSRALQGLSYNEIENAIAICATELDRLDTKRLLEEKKQIVMRSDILEYISSDDSMQDLGGLDNLKQYIKDHTNSHSEEAEAFGVDPVKGILLTGVPGTGKSASAKAIGNYWKVPTLRLDIGRVMTGLVGGSEEKMRAVINMAQSISPCVLWVDELEKALSGTKSSNFSDGGTLSRVFATLLTAMQEGLKGVTVVATANDITALPPELIRRFDEVFFVSLPMKQERHDIFEIHLRKKKRDAKKFDLNKLSNISDKYTGSEIEKSIKEAIARCYNDGKKELTTEDVVSALQDTKPIAVMMESKIDDLVKWAKDKARYASSLAAEEYAPGKQKVKTKSGKSFQLTDSLDTMPEVGKKKEKAEKAEKTEEDEPNRLDHID